MQVSTLLGKDFTYSGSFTQYQNFSNLNQAPHVRILKHHRNTSVVESLLVKLQTEKKPLLLKRTPSEMFFQGVGDVVKFARADIIDNASGWLPLFIERKLYGKDP